MKNIFNILAFVLFSLSVSAQETTDTSQEKQEKSSYKQETKTKQMTDEEINAWKLACKKHEKKKKRKKCSTHSDNCCAKKE